MDIYEMIDAVNVSDKEEAYVGVAVTETLVNIKTQEHKVKKDASCAITSMKIELHGAFFQIDIRFKNPQDPNLRATWMLLEDFGKAQTKAMPKLRDNVDIWFPACSFTIIPSEYCEYGYLVANQPIFWALCPYKPGMKDLNCLRVMFSSDNILVEEEKTDLTKAYAEAKRELENEEYMQFREEEKYIEEMAEQRFKQYRENYENGYVVENDTENLSEELFYDNKEDDV